MGAETHKKEAEKIRTALFNSSKVIINDYIDKSNFTKHEGIGAIAAGISAYMIETTSTVTMLLEDVFGETVARDKMKAMGKEIDQEIDSALKTKRKVGAIENIVKIVEGENGKGGYVIRLDKDKGYERDKE